MIKIFIAFLFLSSCLPVTVKDGQNITVASNIDEALLILCSPEEKIELSKGDEALCVNPGQIAIVGVDTSSPYSEGEYPIEIDTTASVLDDCPDVLLTLNACDPSNNDDGTNVSGNCVESVLPVPFMFSVECFQPSPPEWYERNQDRYIRIP